MLNGSVYGLEFADRNRDVVCQLDSIEFHSAVVSWGMFNDNNLWIISEHKG